MKNFTTEQLCELHNQFKSIFSNKKNISTDFQKMHFKITAELLKRELPKKRILIRYSVK